LGTPVDSKQEAAPLGWHQCAEEGKECSCRGTVRYGSSAAWVEKYVNGAISCTGEEFGDLAGKPKTCQCRPMFTGCELVASTEENKGCYVHTSTRVFTGSGAAKAQCWSDTCACHRRLLSSVGSALSRVMPCDAHHTPSSHALFTLRTRSKWHDSQGDGCDWYAAAPHRCRVYGDSYLSYGHDGCENMLCLLCARSLTHFSDAWRLAVTALDACCACGGGSLKVGTAPHRGLQIFKGDDAHAWSVQGNSPFEVELPQ
jgi:hypothetical protein